MKEIEIGDVVVLKSGGPKMTVNDIFDDGTIECAFFDSKKVMQYKEFKKQILEHYKAPSWGTL